MAKTSQSRSTRKAAAKDAGDDNARLLSAVLGQIPFDGWTAEAITNGHKQAGLSAARAAQIFPHGVADVAQAFGAMADDAMMQRIKSMSGFQRWRVREKIAFAVRARLEFLAAHREALRRLMLWYLLPQHAVAGVKRFAHTVDMMWQAAGDTATDYNRYTKRILLAGVLKATILFWLADESEGQQATWEFLDRRISEVLKLGKSLSLMQEFSWPEIVDVIRRRFKMG